MINSDCQSFFSLNETFSNLRVEDVFLGLKFEIKSIPVKRALTKQVIKHRNSQN